MAPSSEEELRAQPHRRPQLSARPDHRRPLPGPQPDPDRAVPPWRSLTCLHGGLPDPAPPRHKMATGTSGQKPSGAGHRGVLGRWRRLPGNGPGGAAARRARPRGLRERASPPPVSGRDRASAAPGPEAAARRARPARRRRSGCCGGSPLPAAWPSRQLPPRRTAGLVLGHRTQETASSAGSEGAGRTGLAEAALDSCRAALRWQKKSSPCGTCHS